jgi:hypothetical protein
MKKTILGILAMMMVLIWATATNIENSHFVKKMASTSVTQGWKYREGDSPIGKDKKILWINDKDNTSWKNFNIPSKIHIKDTKGYVWLKVVLPKVSFKDPSIYFYTYNQDFEMFISRKSIYRFGSFNRGNSKRLPGSIWHIIELPDNYSGKS